MTLAEKLAGLQRRLKTVDAITYQDSALMDQAIEALDEDERLQEDAAGPRFNQVEVLVDAKWPKDRLESAKAEIVARMDEVDEALMSIKLQIQHAKANVISHGEYADPHWYAKAQAAQRYAGKERQKLQEKLGNVNRLLRAAQAAADDQCAERAFINAARILLPQPEYLRIWDWARRDPVTKVGSGVEAGTHTAKSIKSAPSKAPLVKPENGAGAASQRGGE